jgi:hypothetical protein
MKKKYIIEIVIGHRTSSVKIQHYYLMRSFIIFYKKLTCNYIFQNTAQ